MPYEIQKKLNKFCVVKADSGSIVPGGCHATKEEAENHMKALYSNEPAHYDLQTVEVPQDHIKDMEEVVELLKEAIEKLDVGHSDELPDDIYSSTNLVVGNTSSTYNSGSIAIGSSSNTNSIIIGDTYTSTKLQRTIGTGADTIGIGADTVFSLDPSIMVDSSVTEKAPGYAWKGPITFEQVFTGDNRFFNSGSVVWDDDNLPMPFNWQRSNEHGHLSSVTIGRVDKIWRDPFDSSVIMAEGVILPVNSEAFEYMDLLQNGAAGGVSIDGDDSQFDVYEMTDADGNITDASQQFNRLRIRSLTAVSIPAFKDAQIALVAAAIGATDLPMAPRDQRWDGLSAQKGIFEWAKTETGYDTSKLARAFLWRDSEGDPQLKGSYKLPFTQVINGTLTAIPKAIFAAAAAIEGARGGVNIPEGDKEAIRGKLKTLYKKIEGNPETPFSLEIDMENNVAEEKTSATSNGVYLVADGGPVKPPASWFSITEADEPTPLTITDDGQVYGHIALWDTCHIGLGNCITPPKNDDFSFFHLGETIADDGERYATGKITFNTGHANLDSEALAAASHYDHTGTVGLDVVAVNGKFGIWVSGAARPELSDEQMRTLRAAPISGDWRRIGRQLRLVAALSVNVPGFPVPRARVLVSSGAPEALVFATSSEDMLAKQIEARQRIKNRIMKSVLSGRV